MIRRRTFLKAAGTCLALPNLNIFAGNQQEAVRRFVGISCPLGAYPASFFPQGSGKDYKFTHVNKALEGCKDKVTFFKNLDHGLTGGHQGIHALYSGLKLQDATKNPLKYPQKNISLDQKFADNVGFNTRFHSLSVEPALSNMSNPLNVVSWTRNGIAVPRVNDPVFMFNKLFRQDSAQDIQRKAKQAELQGSILDAVLGQSKTLNSRLGKADQSKMDEYFTSIRDLEVKLASQKQWLTRKKPAVNAEPTTNADQVQLVEFFYDLCHLALVTDSTRAITFHLPFGLDLKPLGINRGYHGCSHHGKSPERIKELQTIDNFHLSQMARFIGKLSDSGILDDTVVAYGSGMSDPSQHSNKCLPIVVAGGGFNHGEHRVYSEDPHKKTPLCNLWVTILQSLGLELESFGNSTGTISGFHMV
ncbi:MAG: DUF1552 domain-containing protein [Lentisphaerales bacterium]|nr:DUF1552 domain-containing protein [Lentisphaerales bacterium]